MCQVVHCPDGTLPCPAQAQSRGTLPLRGGFQAPQTPLCTQQLRAGSALPPASGTFRERRIPVPRAARQGIARPAHKPLQCRCRPWWRWSLVSGNTELNLSSSFLVLSSSCPADRWFAVVSCVVLYFPCLAVLLTFFSVDSNKNTL